MRCLRPQAGPCAQAAATPATTPTLADLIAALLAPPVLPALALVAGAPALAPLAGDPSGAPAVVASPPLGANLLAYPSTLSLPLLASAAALVVVPPGYVAPAFLSGFTVVGAPRLLG